MRTYLRRHGRRLLLANLASLALQAGAFALLTLAGLDVWLATAVAKSCSWCMFALQLLWPLFRNAGISIPTH